MHGYPYTRPGLLRRLFGLSRKVPYSVTAFVRMLRSCREVMEILAREPVMVDTGQYRMKVQPRPYSDMTNEIANSLSQLPNYTARVRFLSSGEHVLETKPLPPGLSGEALAERIRSIKRQMWEQGYTRYYKEVEKEIRERQDALRGTDEADEPPPTSF